jgi:arylsulfatase A-like enzyme
VVLILADDLGYADVGFTGGKDIKTPNLDRLAAAGARLDQFYVQQVCSPTRAALLTGRYPMRHGLQVGVVRPWAQYGLPLDERTLPQALSEAGYFTAIVGKWHLGHFQPEYLPTRRGFQHQYGPYNGAIDYFAHTRDGGLDWHRNDKACHDEGYSTHLLTDEAVRLIGQHDPAKPLFLYVAYNAVHAPHQVPAEYKKPYAHLPEPRRTYAGMLAAMDEGVGKIVVAVNQKGLRKNTLFIFSSDNGGPQPGRVTDNGRYRAGKATLYEGGLRVPAFVTWEGHLKPGSVVSEPLHVVDWYPSVLTLAGASLKQRLPLDGKNVWPTLAQGKPSPHQDILLNATPNSGALRAGNWKLVLDGAISDDLRPATGRRPMAPQTVELFDLSTDPGEKNNVALTHPDVVKDLHARYTAYARQAVPPKFRQVSPGVQSPKVWGERP